MKRKTSIIILTYNHLEFTKDCIESIRKYSQKGSYEIIVIDNASVDGTREWLKKQEDIRFVLNDENLGFPVGCNQGIQIAEKENDLLLLNNDTVVTNNWLKNLKTCLCSSPSIGAVGAISLSNENLQGCDFQYDSLQEMQKLAAKNNISDSSRWEEKVFLIGFCLLIKREVIDQIGLLEEAYSPGYVEDNDLSLRIIEAGYRLILCHDCFVHHYLGTAFRKDLNSFYPILEKNRRYFEEKWKFSTFLFDEIKSASLPLIEHPKKVLEVGCGIGVTLLKLQYLYKECTVHGVEEKIEQATIARHFSKVFSSLSEIEEQDYDYILIGNCLEREKDPLLFLQKIWKFLKVGGCIVGEIHNVASIRTFLSLFDDRWYYKQEQGLHQFTISDIQQMFLEQGFTNGSIFSWYETFTGEEEKFLKQLQQIYNKNYEITYYTFRFQKEE